MTTTYIKGYSPIPGQNNQTPPNGAPEGWPPSSVNDWGRKFMAAVRLWYEDSQWIDYGSAGLAYFDANNFVVDGDQTGFYQVGRRVRAIGTTPFTIYGVITDSVYTSSTKVTVAWDTATTLNNTLSELALGPSKLGLPNDEAIPQANLASAATTDLGTVPSRDVKITGGVTITSFGASASVSKPLYFIEFAAALTLTYDATALKLPTSANIVTEAGDFMIAEYQGSGNWNVLQYFRRSGKALSAQQIIQPTRQYLKTGTTYTTPANCKAILARYIGGGGGGAGADSSSTANGTAGGDTTFNGIAAKGGSPGTFAYTGGIGGINGTGTASLRIAGAHGGDAGYGSGGSGAIGGQGGSGPWGGAGAGADATPGARNGYAAAANSGSGGGGVGVSSTYSSGGGGGAGEYVELYIASPSATYTFSIGTAGTGGTGVAGSGGAGGSGLIIVEEYY